ncbi:translation elongation factor [Oceanobacillus picturae]|nr:translation elongation factor [Oceanobacillus picturae]
MKKNPEQLTLTNKVWEKIFEENGVLDRISEKGFYQIKAKTIKNAGREPRLMAKFDHKKNLPFIFKKNHLSILPISRSEYIIGKFDAYQDVTYNRGTKPEFIEFPSNITTVDPTNLYSESSALHCASLAGILDDVVGEETVQTISGRMSSKEFDFRIGTHSGLDREINIKNSQVEIDGGYESDSQFMIVEAKKETVNDFLIRQLYYPYRLWKEQTNKTIRPVFFTHSNDVFSFFIYEFTDSGRYNSIRLLERKDYTFVNDNIELDDILEVMEYTEVISEPEVPFPQADNIIRLIDLLEKLVLGNIEKETVTLNYDFDVRQTQYYTDAGRYLGLINKQVKNRNGISKIVFSLTREGRRIMQLSYKEKRLNLVAKILEHKPFKMVLNKYLRNSSRPSKEQVVDILIECEIYNVQSISTFKRRSSTVLSWIDWVLGLQHELN